MVILVTGAEGALGSAVTTRFLSAGHEVWGTYHKAKSENSKVRWVQTDLADPASVKALARECAARVDAVIHCAGGYRWAPAESTSDADLDFLLGSNLRSAFLLVREFLPKMKERDAGNLVFVSSKQTFGPKHGHAAYAAAKAGLNMLVLTLAEELRSTKINVNAVLPTIIDTPANREAMPDADTSAWVSTQDLASVIYSLTQPESRAVTGSLIPVSGRL